MEEPGLQELGRTANEAVAAKAAAEADLARVKGKGTDIQRKVRPLLPPCCCELQSCAWAGPGRAVLSFQVQIQGRKRGVRDWHAMTSAVLGMSGTCATTADGSDNLPHHRFEITNHHCPAHLCSFDD